MQLITVLCNYHLTFSALGSLKIKLLYQEQTAVWHGLLNLIPWHSTVAKGAEKGQKETLKEKMCSVLIM